MIYNLNNFFLFFIALISFCPFSGAWCENEATKTFPLFYWEAKKFENFGDYLSVKLVERITGNPVRIFRKNTKKGAIQEIKLLAIGSIITFASNGDVIWGSGINGKSLEKNKYMFNHLDIRSVRGPLTRQYLFDNFQIESPEIYGDPALLLPYFFPEFKKAEIPKFDYVIIPHYSELKLFPKELFGDNIIYPTEAWDEVIKKILNSKFVISSSLHGIVVAEAYGIPARMLRITPDEPLFKYFDYYFGTNRPHFLYATSIEEALKMGGEPPFECDLEKLYRVFPFELWPQATFKHQLEITHEKSNI